MELCRHPLNVLGLSLSEGKEGLTKSKRCSESISQIKGTWSFVSLLYRLLQAARWADLSGLRSVPNPESDGMAKEKSFCKSLCALNSHFNSFVGCFQRIWYHISSRSSFANILHGGKETGLLFSCKITLVDNFQQTTSLIYLSQVMQYLCVSLLIRKI